MSRRDPDILLDDIRTAISKIERYCAGLRNRIVHDYAGIDLELIWEVVQTGLPTFRDQIQKL